MSAIHDYVPGLPQSVGATDPHPTDPSVPVGDAATAGVTRAQLLLKTPLPPETIAEKVRNALMMLNAAGRESEPIIDQNAPDGPEAHNARKYREFDIQAMQRLLTAAAAQDDAQVASELQLRKVIIAAHREIAKLNLVIEEQRKRRDGEARHA